MAGQQRVSTPAVRQAATNIANFNHGIRNDFGDVERAMSSLANSWRGEASERAQSAFFSIRNAYLTDRFSVVDSYVRFLRNPVADGYDVVERKVTDLSKEFKGG